LKKGIAITNFLVGPQALVVSLRIQLAASCAGNLNSIFSSRPGSTETDTGPIRRRALIYIVDQNLGRRGTGRDADIPCIAEPFRIELAAVGDEVARHAGLGTDFAKPVGVGAIGGAHHQDNVHELAQVPYRRLTVLCRIADIPDVGALNICKTRVKCGDYVLGIVHTQRRLGDVGDRGVDGQ
jgi:hypothetical protein